MLQLYDFEKSGNCYKARLLLAHLEMPYERIEVNSRTGETRQPPYLAVNPKGQIPALAVEGAIIAESSAILFYLADGTAYLSGARLARAQCVQWMAFEQANILANIGLSRKWITTGQAEANRKALDEKHKLGHEALAIMEAKLADRDFFVGDRYSIADIALFGYTHLAEEGNFSLRDYSRVRSWIERVKSQPGWVPMIGG